MSTAARVQLPAMPRVCPAWLAKSSIIAKSILHNWRGRFEPNSAAGAVRTDKSLTERLDAIDRVYRDYVFYGNLSREDIEGRRLREVGPEGDLGVALQFLAAGAEQVIVLDPRATVRNTGRTLRLYHALRERTWGEERRRFDSAIDLRHGIRIAPARLRVIRGVPLEDAGDLLAAASFSLIVSWETLDAVHEIDRAFYTMERLLRPGGRMLHKVPLGDRGMFSEHGLHPLEFLTVPESVYMLMTACSGRPNRRRVDYYWRMMRELGYHAGLLATSVLGQPGEVLPHRLPVDGAASYPESAFELVRAIRPRLARPFRGLADEDLLVTGIFLGAFKPA
jgi:hypothetical protein